MSKKDDQSRRADHKEHKSSQETASNEQLLTEPSHAELIEQLNQAEQKANQNWERLLRLQADYDNHQRRTEKDIANAHKYALEKFVGELIPIIDSLELCVNNVPKGADQTTIAVVEGVKLTLKMFYTAMEKFSVKQVNPVNKPFNPEYEQAISVQESEHVEPNTVLSVLQKGYTLNNRLIRPALVVVSQAKKS